jgi:L-asparaginase
MLRELSSATAAGIAILAISQCMEGGIALGQYAAGGQYADYGVIDGATMCRSAAFSKLWISANEIGPGAPLDEAWRGEYG